MVSVLIPCYNHEKYVGQAIESVLGQTYPNIELLVLLNGSKDGSYDVVKHYGDKVKILQLEKNDFLQAMEELRSHSNGKYIATMTSDDYWVPEKIEKQIKILEQNSSVKACFTWVNLVNDNGETVIDRKSGMCNVGSYNVGPDDVDCWTTGNLVTLFCNTWNCATGEHASWENRYDGGPHEAAFLKLDCSKLKSIFQWTPKWDLQMTMEKIVEWTVAYLNGEDVVLCMMRQVEEYADILEI